MKERVGQTLGRKEARRLMISTFHTLGLDIIKREYAALGMKSTFPCSMIPTRSRCSKSSPKG